HKTVVDPRVAFPLWACAPRGGRPAPAPPPGRRARGAVGPHRGAPPLPPPPPPDRGARGRPAVPPSPRVAGRGEGGVDAALALARRANSAALEPALHAVDRRLLAVLERCRSFLDPHLVTFRVPELERCQHAAAAALAGARWGVAGLRTVIADTAAPLGRRY